MSDALPRYFGCHNRQGGHYSFGPGLGGLAADDLVGNFLSANDGRFAPRGNGQQYNHDECDEGVASVHVVQLGGHILTVLSFWDRSVDHRGASSSTFAVEGRCSFKEAVFSARSAFPKVWARYEFEIKPRFGQ